MTGLRAAEDYLAMRRALGFKLTTQGRQLMWFVGYCEPAAATTSPATWRWSGRPRPAGAAATRLPGAAADVVRIFARHLQTLDPATEVPPDDVLPHHTCRIPPYLYSPGEVAALMNAADASGRRCGRRPGGP